MEKMWGLFFLVIYIITIGVGSFLQKFVMDRITPYQLEVITAIGMFIVSVPALFIVQKNFHIPLFSTPLALLVGLLFSIGSFVYVLAVSRLPLSIAAPVSMGYVVLAVTLSAIFLKEPISLFKGIGIAFTIIGVVMLSLQKS